MIEMARKSIVFERAPDASVIIDNAFSLTKAEAFLPALVKIWIK